MVAPEAAAGGAVRLDKRTYLEQSRYVAKLRDFGDGLSEVGWSFVGVAQANKKPRGQSLSREENDERACRRAKSRLRHLILASRADHLLTLTYRENVTDYKQAERHFTRFVKRVKQAYPNWSYVAVAEQQLRGAWHWHLAVCGWQDVAFLRSAWRRCVSDGNIDVQHPKGRRGNRRLRLVAYLSKYMAKSFANLHNLSAHRYRASLGIEIPCKPIPIPFEARTDVCSYVLTHLRALVGSDIFIWQSEEYLAGWACSW